MLRQSALLRCPVLRHRIKRVPGSFLRAEILYPGAAMEDDMAVDTAVDAELWLILVAMIGWIILGCFMTARHRHHGPRQSPRH